MPTQELRLHRIVALIASLVTFDTETLKGTSMKRAHLPFKNPSSKVTWTLPLTNRWLELIAFYARLQGHLRALGAHPTKRRNGFFG